MSKSDDKLRAELNDAGVKQTVTLAEARAEAASGSKTKATKTGAIDGASDGNNDKPAKAARPRIAPGSTPSQVLQAHITNADELHAATRLVKGDEADANTFKLFATKVDKLAKKVGEKAVNLIRYRSAPASVQGYTKIGLDLLIEQGTITSKDLVERYRTNPGHPYKDGTARAQGNQLFQLFPALDIATREDKGTLKLNKDSLIVADYRKASK